MSVELHIYNFTYHQKFFAIKVFKSEIICPIKNHPNITW